MLNTLFPTPFRVPSLALLSNALAQASPANWPGLNAWRDADNFLVELEIPGFAENEIEVLATGDSLSIRGERTLQVPEDATPLHIEQPITRFERVLNLPVPIDTNAVKAELVNGVLRVTIPVAEQARARRIQVGETKR
jgi:HSP20 family protein